MTTSDEFLSGHPFKDTNYGHWPVHWNPTLDLETNTATKVEFDMPSVSLLESRSPLSTSHSISHSLQHGYTVANSLFSPLPSGNYGGSTPVLVPSSLSTPPTGKSTSLLLTPDQGMQTGHHLPTSDRWNQLTHLSPVRVYSVEGSATPDVTKLSLNSPTNYEEFGFRMVRPSWDPRQSSVLLESSSSLESPQSNADLDPLDLGNQLVDLNGQGPSFTGTASSLRNYNITVLPAQNVGHSTSVKVIPDDTTCDSDILLSPLKDLGGLPLEYPTVEEFPCVIIQPTHWCETASPAPNKSQAISDHQPPHVRPASNSALIPTSPHPTCNSQTTRCHAYENDASSSVHSALRDSQTEQHRIINPKGVSNRTLTAAAANRKREAKFHCAICSDSQTSKQNLQNHIYSRHMQLKRFLCPVEGCQARYGHARGVNRHLDSKHPGHRQANVKDKRGPSKHT